ncbi:E4, partial [Rattus norvegicus papillomavirus 2]
PEHGKRWTRGKFALVLSLLLALRRRPDFLEGIRYLSTGYPPQDIPARIGTPSGTAYFLREEEKELERKKKSTRDQATQTTATTSPPAHHPSEVSSTEEDPDQDPEQEYPQETSPRYYGRPLRRTRAPSPYPREGQGDRGRGDRPRPERELPTGKHAPKNDPETAPGDTEPGNESGTSGGRHHQETGHPTTSTSTQPTKTTGGRTAPLTAVLLVQTPPTSPPYPRPPGYGWQDRATLLGHPERPPLSWQSATLDSLLQRLQRDFEQQRQAQLIVYDVLGQALGLPAF